MRFQTIVAIKGMPRSGTSWLGQIFDSSPDTRFRLSPLFSYEFKNQLNEGSSRADWERVLNGAYESENEFMNQTERRRSGEYPVFEDKCRNPSVLVLKATRFHNLSPHLIRLFGNACRIVAIIRHPGGAINSWLRAPREFPQGADPMTEWRSGACRKTGYGEYWGFDDWMATTRMYVALAKTHPRLVLLQKYEELVRNPLRETRRMFEFCGLPLTQQTRDFLEQSHKHHHAGEYAVFKSPTIVDAWRDQLPRAIAQEIEAELANSDLREFHC